MKSEIVRRICTNSILEGARKVVDILFLRQIDEETQSVTLSVGICVMFSTAFSEAGAFTRSPRVTEFIVSQWCLKVSILLTPAQTSS